jgi:hypothetical protein
LYQHEIFKLASAKPLKFIDIKNNFGMSPKQPIGFPHDLLKPYKWKEHGKPDILSEKNRRVLSRYKTAVKYFNGSTDWLTLEKVIKGHHTEKAWIRPFAIADKLAAAVARLKVEYDYWHEEQENPFLIKVYGEKSWPPEERRKLCSEIFQILEQYAEDESKHAEALRKINELLTFFPSDSRFPFVGLKTHHQLTDVLRLNPAIIEKCRDKEPKISELYLARISLAEPEFHRLKKMREFFELRRKFITFARSMLEDYHPMQVGDDVYVVLASPHQVNILKGSLLKASLEAGLGVDLEIFMWPLKREYGLFVVDGEQSELVSLGSHEEWEYRPESHTEWVRILEGDYEYVAWISIRPREDKVSRKISMEKIAKEFLDWAEEELKRRYDKIRRPVENPISQSISLSPELLLSIVEGYDEFVEDCARLVNPEKPEGNIAIRSFSQTIMLKGLNEPSEGLKLYLNLARKKANLHMPAILTAIVSKPQYPFWRILELLKHEKDNITFVVGEKMVILEDNDIKLLREVIPLIRSTSRSQFHELINKSRRIGLEHLKMEIEGKGADGKIPRNASSKLCWLINRLSQKYRGDELADKIYHSLKALEPFTRKEERRRWERR